MKPIVLVFEDDDALSLIAAELFVLRANEAMKKHGRFLVALAGGGTPRKLYELLASHEYVNRVPWRNSYVFWGDERLVPPRNAESSYGMTQEILLRHVPIPHAHIFRAMGEADIDTAVSDYAMRLATFSETDTPPRFDLVLLGLGRDGHTASLFPGPISDVEQVNTVIPVTAHYEDRPAQRLTLTPLVINAAANVMFLVTGSGKAPAVQAVLEGDRATETWPAQRINLDNGLTTWLLDVAAAARLSESLL